MTEGTKQNKYIYIYMWSVPSQLPRLVSSMEEKLTAAQTAYDAFEEERANLTDTKRDSKNLGSCYFRGDYENPP